VKKLFNSNNSKIYCERCDLILESREKFNKHLSTHSSTIPCDVCPIDIIIDKFVNVFRKKPSRNLE
jgi:hypothetical protein